MRIDKVIGVYKGRKWRIIGRKKKSKERERMKIGGVECKERIIEIIEKWINERKKKKMKMDIRREGIRVGIKEEEGLKKDRWKREGE